jgi:hypothetical protein
MIATITLWTMLLWAESRASSSSLESTQINGFATQEACLTALAQITGINKRLQNERGSARSGETGVDFKLTMCIPVETPKS